tara:strand:- start:935 stop:1438 length:504 start_codon:yes stop_codon:yes gene_type:complete
MSNFYKLLGERFQEFPQIRIKRYLEDLLQKEVVKKLNLSGMGALRDRFDGQLFLDKNRSRLFSNLALREYFEEPIDIRNEKLLDENKKFIVFNDKKYQILVFQFGQLPRINSDEIKGDVILICQRDKFINSIIGIVSEENIKDKNNLKRNDNYFDFIGFDKVEKILK